MSNAGRRDAIVRAQASYIFRFPRKRQSARSQRSSSEAGIAETSGGFTTSDGFRSAMADSKWPADQTKTAARAQVLVLMYRDTAPPAVSTTQDYSRSVGLLNGFWRALALATRDRSFGPRAHGSGNSYLKKGYEQNQLNDVFATQTVAEITLGGFEVFGKNVNGCGDYATSG